jgi:hypothetical protein
MYRLSWVLGPDSFIDAVAIPGNDNIDIGSVVYPGYSYNFMKVLEPTKLLVPPLITLIT